MKETASKSAALLTLLMLTLASTQVVNSGNANMYAEATTPPPPGTIPPAITVANSENESVIQLVANIASASCPTKYSLFSLPEVYYKGDWMTNESFGGYVDKLTLPLNNASSGTHLVLIRAEQGCFYGNEDGVPYYFRTNSSLIVKFMVENAQPFSAKILAIFYLVTPLPNVVSLLSPENKTFISSTIPLDFTVNDLTTQLSYSLDGHDNVTIAGNTTLTALSDGEHYVTVYYADILGNVGTSETTYFNVDTFYLTTLIIAASGASLVMVGLGLLVYFKKRKRGVSQE